MLKDRNRAECITVATFGHTHYDASYPSRRCVRCNGVRFCAEHRNEQRALSLNAVPVSSARSETPPTPDRDDDSGSSNDAMDEDNRLQHHHIALSSLFTPSSPPNHACATTTYLTVSQQDLVEQFSILADDLYQSST